MLVLDASVVAEYLIGSSRGAAARASMREQAGRLHVPHLAIVETASVLRAWVRRGTVSEPRAAAALADLNALPARRWPAEPLLPRMWELRDNVTSYDACYLALAEALDAALLTCDGRLARATAAHSAVRVTVV